MLYLEKLTLYLRIDDQGVFMDPIHLINEFSMYMSRLLLFYFYLSTENQTNDLVHYLSNNDTKQTYRNIGYQEVSNIVSYDDDTTVYHVFTLPFEFNELMFIGNIFPNIVFSYVISLWVRDVVPFEHEFFVRIAQAFPLLKELHVYNIESKSSDDIESYPIVEYPHLTSLNMMSADMSYIEQFLNETKTHLPCLTKLRILYENLRIITNNFTKEATRRNCANVTRLITGRQFAGSKDFYIYFPLL
jgi:hypothetical protein